MRMLFDQVEGVMFPVPSSLCTAAHLFRDGCPTEVAIFTFHSVGIEWAEWQQTIHVS